MFVLTLRSDRWRVGTQKHDERTQFLDRGPVKTRRTYFQTEDQRKRTERTQPLPGLSDQQIVTTSLTASTGPGGNSNLANIRRSLASPHGFWQIIRQRRSGPLAGTPLRTVNKRGTPLNTRWSFGLVWAVFRECRNP